MVRWLSQPHNPMLITSELQYLINHILNIDSSLGFTMPNTAALAQTNAVTGVGSLSAQAELCFSEQGYLPTFTLVDYYDVGNGSVFGSSSSLRNLDVAD